MNIRNARRPICQLYHTFPAAIPAADFMDFFTSCCPQSACAGRISSRAGRGWGKSTLMKRVGAAWEKQGKQVEYYWCSGDPESLDAVVADGCMLMDGTAPHVIDPALPGAADGIINLGECLDETIMAAHREEVLRVMRDISRCYGRAYRYLTGADAALRDMQEVYAQAVDQGALINLRMELMAFVQGKEGPGQHLYAQAISCKGVAQHLDSLVRENILCLDLPFGFDADTLLRPLSLHLGDRHIAHRAFMHPLDGKRHAHIATKTHSVVTFLEPGRDVRTLPFDEDILRREHDALSFSRAAYDLLLHQAIDSLHQAKEKHDVLERIYADAMDYKKLDDMQGKFVLRMTT